MADILDQLLVGYVIYGSREIKRLNKSTRVTTSKSAVILTETANAPVSPHNSQEGAQLLSAGLGEGLAYLKDPSFIAALLCCRYCFRNCVRCKVVKVYPP